VLNTPDEVDVAVARCASWPRGLAAAVFSGNRLTAL
jgi:hypothetical protein